MCHLIRFVRDNNPGCCELQIHQAVSLCPRTRELGGLWPADHLLKVHTAVHSLKALCLGMRITLPSLDSFRIISRTGWSITGRSYTVQSCSGR